MVNRKLKAARAEKGLNQKQFSNLIQMPFSTYQKKETGQSEFTITEAKKISDILQKNIEEIFFTNEVTV